MPLSVPVFVFGALVGSFLNVCIYRIPRGLSIVWPSSACPACGAPIRPWDNIPILSFLLLRGRCRACGARISLRYPLVEALNAALYVVLLDRFWPGWQFPVYAAFCSSLIVITFIDLDFQIIPDRITLPGIAAGLLAGSLLLPDPFLRAADLGWRSSVIGAAAGFSIYYLIAELSVRLLKKEGMGGGDIKLMAMIGGFLGWKGVLLTTFLGSLSGSIAGLAYMAFSGKGRGTIIPFGPFLALGAAVSLLFGQEILLWYISRN
ncbi:MAG: A24 family peptidase [Thermodesulfovibrionales bacterium]